MDEFAVSGLLVQQAGAGGGVDLLNLAQTVGLPLTLVLIAFEAGRRRTWVWGQELTDCEARMEKQARDYEARLEAQRLAHQQREAELTARMEHWERLFFDMLGPITSLADVIARRGAKEAP